MAKAKRQRGCKEDRIDPGHIQKLLELANAKDGYLTRAQFVRFLDHPDGPILPDACIEMRRLSTYFGTHGAGWVADPSDPIKDLSVRPTDGAPCIATVRRGMNIVVCGGDEYELIADKPGCQSNLRIIGFHPENHLPITHLQMFSYNGLDGCMSEGPGRIFVGRRIVRDIPGAETVMLLSNGDVVLWTQLDQLSPRWQWHVWRDGGIIATTELRYTKFVELADGGILGIRNQGDIRPTLEPYPDGCCVAPINDERRVLCNGIVDVVVTRERIFGVRSELGACSIIHMSTVSGEAVSDVQYIGPNRYITGYTMLPDDRAAYIGEMKHSKLPCWVVAGEEQIAFERVSPLFLDGERWCYWGALGRRLYKMEISSV